MRMNGIYLQRVFDAFMAMEKERDEQESHRIRHYESLIKDLRAHIITLTHALKKHENSEGHK